MLGEEFYKKDMKKYEERKKKIKEIFIYLMENSNLQYST